MIRAEGKLTTSITDAKESIATLADETKLGAGIKALDKNVAEATGVTLSVKLEQVRKAALQAPGADQAGPSPGQPMSKDKFHQFCSQYGTNFG